MIGNELLFCSNSKTSVESTVSWSGGRGGWKADMLDRGGLHKLDLTACYYFKNPLLINNWNLPLTGAEVGVICISDGLTEKP